MSKIVYQTNKAGVYVGETYADESPLEPGVYLIPGGCVEISPGEIPNGMMAVWNRETSTWNITPIPVDTEQTNEETVPLTEEQIIKQYTNHINSYVETIAVSKQYNSAAHIASYVTSTVPSWAAEAAAFISWRDQVWLYSINEMELIQSGQKTLPSVEEFMSGLPQIVWP